MKDLHHASITPTPASMHTPTTAQAVFIEGADAIAFAHNQFTSDVTTLPVGRWQFSSWLDAQGRVRCMFHLARVSDERLLLILRGGQAESFIDALRRFVFRSRVTLSVAQGTLANGPAMEMHHLATQDDIFVLGCGSHAMQFGSPAGTDDTWRQKQLHNGWAWLPDPVLNELLPPSLSLHRLGAISLGKGCYPGQEIVARLHYRGGNKRHLHLVKLSACVQEGTLLQRNGREFVRLLNITSCDERVEALAVMSDDIASNVAQGVENTSDDGVAIRLLDTWSD